jgi:hypothetical protein
MGSLAFGQDGALYVSAGDGASFNYVDYGQDGSPLNPCDDPPAGAGGVMSPPTAEGGALRAQDLRTMADPVGLNGALLRVDPVTGAGLPDNPLRRAATPMPVASLPTDCVIRFESRHDQEPERSGSGTSAGATGRRSIASSTLSPHRSRTSAGRATKATDTSPVTTQQTSRSARISMPRAPPRSLHRISHIPTTIWSCPMTVVPRAVRPSAAPRSRQRAAARTRPTIRVHCFSRITPGNASG